ncbi:MAG: glycosyltransferase [Gloeobacteraceae cyanobacterium ES-bin-144]|nr:glycosyltransferase [Verrucomicrobiales bacterium]
MKRRSITVISPSRSQPNQAEFLERACASIRSQSVITGYDLTILVGVDEDEKSNTADLAATYEFSIAESNGKSQASALNAAIRQANTEFVAFLEDDDCWAPSYLQIAERELASGSAFVSSTQLEYDEYGVILRINDFPTPSGWIMPMETLRAVGEFNEEYRFHLDNEWLGRLSETGFPRVHLVESTAPIESRFIGQIRPWLANAIQYSENLTTLVRHQSPIPLVSRLVHSQSGMAQISANPLLAEISANEEQALRNRFGRIPW